MDFSRNRLATLKARQATHGNYTGFLDFLETAWRYELTARRHNLSNIFFGFLYDPSDGDEQLSGDTSYVGDIWMVLRENGNFIYGLIFGYQYLWNYTGIGSNWGKCFEPWLRVWELGVWCFEINCQLNWSGKVTGMVGLRDCTIVSGISCRAGRTGWEMKLGVFGNLRRCRKILGLPKIICTA